MKKILLLAGVSAGFALTGCSDIGTLECNSNVEGSNITFKIEATGDEVTNVTITVDGKDFSEDEDYLNGIGLGNIKNDYKAWLETDEGKTSLVEDFLKLAKESFEEDGYKCEM